MRIFLVANVLGWLPYGLFLLANPAFLADAAGVSSATPTGHSELRAMYGGLQAAIGLWAACALLRPEWQRAAVLSIAFLLGGLGAARLLGVLVDGGLSAYTGGALAFEFGALAWACVLLRRAPQPAAV